MLNSLAMFSVPNGSILSTYDDVLTHRMKTPKGFVQLDIVDPSKLCAKEIVARMREIELLFEYCESQGIYALPFVSLDEKAAEYNACEEALIKLGVDKNVF